MKSNESHGIGNQKTTPRNTKKCSSFEFPLHKTYRKLSARKPKPGKLSDVIWRLAHEKLPLYANLVILNKNVQLLSFFAKKNKKKVSHRFQNFLGYNLKSWRNVFSRIRSVKQMVEEIIDFEPTQSRKNV